MTQFRSQENIHFSLQELEGTEKYCLKSRNRVHLLNSPCAKHAGKSIGSNLDAIALLQARDVQPIRRLFVQFQVIILTNVAVKGITTLTYSINLSILSAAVCPQHSFEHFLDTAIELYRRKVR